jgi:hypothetical protein
MTKGFVYRPIPPELVTRRLAIYGWPKGIYQAYKYDTKALCKYLRSHDLPLNEEKRDDLADLIERRIQRKQGKGRKPGVIPRNPDLRDAMSTGDVVAHAKTRLKRIRARNGGRAPKGSYKQVIEDVCRDLADQGLEVDADFDKALADLRRGRPARPSRKS